MADAKRYALSGHPFFVAGMGKPPWRLRGMYDTGGHCACCGTRIRYVYRVESCGGRTWDVGRECIMKIGGWRNMYWALAQGGRLSDSTRADWFRINYAKRAHDHAISLARQFRRSDALRRHSLGHDHPFYLAGMGEPLWRFVGERSAEQGYEYDCDCCNSRMEYIYMIRDRTGELWGVCFTCFTNYASWPHVVVPEQFGVSQCAIASIK